MKKHGIRKKAGANPAAEILEAPMSAARLAKLLSEGGDRPIAPAVVHSHVAEGAPADRRGRIRLVDYAAWLARRLTMRREDDRGD